MTAFTVSKPTVLERAGEFVVRVLLQMHELRAVEFEHTGKIMRAGTAVRSVEEIDALGSEDPAGMFEVRKKVVRVEVLDDLRRNDNVECLIWFERSQMDAVRDVPVQALRLCEVF